MAVPLDQSSLQNTLLAGLQPDLFAILAPHLVPASLERNHVIESHDEPISRVCFPGLGVISVVARTAGNTRMETGLIGPEGMTGVALLYGVDRTPHETFVQIPCRVMSLSASDLHQALVENPPLHRYLLRYAYAFSIQVAQTALCNTHFTIEQRLARWLLMSHDRVDREDIMLTQEFLSLMLGVRRASITTALRNLVSLGSIGIYRGTIVIRNRELLLASADGAYGSSEASYAAIMEIAPPDPAA